MHVNHLLIFQLYFQSILLSTISKPRKYNHYHTNLKVTSKSITSNEQSHESGIINPQSDFRKQYRMPKSRLLTPSDSRTDRLLYHQEIAASLLQIKIAIDSYISTKMKLEFILHELENITLALKDMISSYVPDTATTSISFNKLKEEGYDQIANCRTHITILKENLKKCDINIETYKKFNLNNFKLRNGCFGFVKVCSVVNEVLEGVNVLSIKFLHKMEIINLKIESDKDCFIPKDVSAEFFVKFRRWFEGLFDDLLVVVVLLEEMDAEILKLETYLDL